MYHAPESEVRGRLARLRAGAGGLRYRPPRRVSAARRPALVAGGAPPQLQNEATQEVYWELQKFITLALKANPNVLECLYTPLVETATPLGEELLALRGNFLSKLVHQTYTHYVLRGDSVQAHAVRAAQPG